MDKLIRPFYHKKKHSFTRADFTEDCTKLENPGQGWYRVYSFAVEDEIQEDELIWCLAKEEQLALVLIDIGCYKSKPLDETALIHIRKILQFFSKEGKDIILRIAYDREGKGLEREPSFLSMIQNHMEQTGVIIQEYAEHIFTLQGLFIGNWGEMHGSKFLSKDMIKRLADTLWKATGGTCYMAVRRPVQWRTLFSEGQMPGIQAENRNASGKTGLFDDGMLASKSHLGTFGESRKEEAGWQASWKREDELDFEHKLCLHVPIGGEAVYGDGYDSSPFVIETLRHMHVSYLNSVYDARILNQWKDMAYLGPGVYQGITLYDYIGIHLGYRFVVRNVDYNYRKNKRLSIEIENVGFSNLYQETQVSLILKETGENETSPNQIKLREKKLLLPCDARTWDSGKHTIISQELDKMEPGTYQIYLNIKRKWDGRIIRFANKEAGNQLFLGTLRNAK